MSRVFLFSSKNMLIFAAEPKNDRIMNFRIEETSDKYVVTLEGEMDTSAVRDIKGQIETLYKGDKDVVIDCSSLTYISSSGLRILLNILKAANHNGKSVTLCGVNDDVRNVFVISGFVNLFKLES